MGRSKENDTPRKRAIRRTLLTGLAFIVGFIIFGVIAIQVWEYSNSVSFCTDTCHNVHPEESASYQDFYHASVKCTECHMGRVNTIRGIVLKAAHFRHLPEVLFDKYERPLESVTMRPANESCERCHWPPAFHGDTVREIKTFQPDENNTEESIYLILKTGAGTRPEGLGYGIHWHITNPVEYIATDERKQDIRWIRTTLPDGRTVEYNDVTNPLTPEQIAGMEKHTMDCVDCHNRMGHPFFSPDELINEALADGQISTDLPYIKREMLDLLSASYPNQEVALEAVDQFKQEYASKLPEAAMTQPAAVDQAEATAKDLITRLVFEEPGVTWQDFPNNQGHKDFAGCFRCHDGKHVSSDGESIRLHCNICHSIPMTVGANDRTPEMPVSTVSEPASHLETNFIADHRFQANDSCYTCHGEIEFGTDDSNFCSNSACHGQAWPAVQLDAAFPHPIPLEGGHANVWCYQCHEGVEKPEYVCSNCHEPPTVPHFGDNCEECHTTAGFGQADLGSFQHPVALEGAHANLQCTDCHTAGQVLTYDCSACHTPPSATHFRPNCQDCHSPTTPFQDATIPPELHPIPLIGAHLRATCDVCHAEGQRVPEYVCSDCHKPPENHFTATCDTCHTPEGWDVSAARIIALAPPIPHDVEGRDDCLVCHNPAGQIKPAPANHADYTSQQCRLCHQLED